MPILCSTLFGAVDAIAQTASAPANLVEQGRRIYLEGIDGTGNPLQGVRADNARLVGAQAACVNCHKRSGMGSVEGDILIQPITGNYLFNPDKFQLATMDPRTGKKFNLTHAAYTEESLALAITSGVNNSGRKMHPLMPNYPIDKSDMAALSAYLKELSKEWSPGVSKDNIRLATVITPEVEGVRRKAFVDTLQKAVMQKNGSTLTSQNKKGRRHMISAAEMVLGTERTWTLDIWELQGAPETWGAQLEEKYKAQPVFALLSGLSNSTWEPIQNFCENTQVPCWFPSSSLPPATESFYSLYYSRGVNLEADVLAKYLSGNKKPKRVVQIRRDDIIANEAAKRLNTSLAAVGITSEDRVFKAKADEPISIQQVTNGLTSDDVTVFWLRRTDLTELGKSTPPPVKAVYFSAEMAGGEQGIPSSWQSITHLIYPYELPDKRQSNLTNFHAWQTMKKLPLIDEPLQAEAFFAVEFLTETLAEMLDNIYRDYLIERSENMLSRNEAIKSEQQVRERVMWSKTGSTAKQQGTSIYPHLGLGVNQHFASKGAYIVGFTKEGKLMADSDWIVP
ncbi:MAG: hypothetical protein HOO92_02630 [Methylococcaceae bacterium]|nr:hypothetical protein [Methylococcaceae bacterium]